MVLGFDTLNPATPFSGRFKQEEIPNLNGRVAIVTGGSAGIGYHDALGLARTGAKVLIISATPAHGEGAEKEMNEFLAKETTGKGSVKWHGVDFENLKDVDALTKRLTKEEDRLDILINNAAVGQAPWKLTNDEIEAHFTINNLAPYILTLRLLPLMKQTAKTAPPNSARIVMQSSEMHRMAPNNARFASLEEINEKRDGAVLYGRTKLGLIYFAKQLVKRKLPSNEILVTSCHPGTVDTDMQRAWTESYGKPGKFAEFMTRLMGKSAPEGSEASLWLATSNDIGPQHQGNYYSEANGKAGAESGQAQDEATGSAWWDFCRQRVREILREDVE